MTQKKKARNARIVRLRNGVIDHTYNKITRSMTWAEIADRIAKEFPKDKCSWQRCQAIYKRDTTGVLLNDGAEWYRRKREKNPV